MFSNLRAFGALTVYADEVESPVDVRRSETTPPSDEDAGDIERGPERFMAYAHRIARTIRSGLRYGVVRIAISKSLRRRQRLLVLGALVIVLRVLQVCCLFQRRWRIVPSSGKPNVGQCKLRNCWHIHCRRCCVPRLPSTAAGQEHERHRPRRRGDVSVPGVRIAALAFGNHPHSSRAIPKGTLKAVSTEFRLLKTDIVVTRAWFCGVTRRFSAAVR